MMSMGKAMKGGVMVKYFLFTEEFVYDYESSAVIGKFDTLEEAAECAPHGTFVVELKKTTELINGHEAKVWVETGKVYPA